jgi:hypothetical protein
MYDPRDYSSPSWIYYRWFRRVFWLMLIAVVPVFVFAPIEISLIFGLAFFAYYLGIPYIPCPICNKPVGHNGSKIYIIVQASPWGGHCHACGEKLFNRK